MDQNQGVGSDLQKAIDNITNTGTNSAPAFSDPVAAPSTIPEGDSGELGEPVGPFPMPPAEEPKVGIVTPGSEPIAPIDPISIPDLGANGDAKVTPAVKPNDSEPIMPAGSGPMESNGNEPIAPAEPSTEPTMGMSPDAGPDMGQPAEADRGGAHFESSENPNARQIKEAALRDLVPLIDHVNAEPSQKFEICRNIMEDLHDSSVLDQAYKAASNISNEDERAKALLYIIESID